MSTITKHITRLQSLIDLIGQASHALQEAVYEPDIRHAFLHLWSIQAMAFAWMGKRACGLVCISTHRQRTSLQNTAAETDGAPPRGKR